MYIPTQRHTCIHKTKINLLFKKHREREGGRKVRILKGVLKPTRLIYA
jgi:hypothetical protein